jgi:hypothetical protein
MWRSLVDLEPELAQLRLEVESIRDEGGQSFCANKVWYIWIEPRVRELVGAHARSGDPLLRSRAAHEVTRETLYRLLPNCRNCVCVPW